VQAEKANIPAHGLKGLGPVIGLARGAVLVSELPLQTAGDPYSLANYLRAWQTNGGRAQLQGFDLRWDAIDVSASGRMVLDGRGRPAGEIDTHIGGHAAIVDVLTANRFMAAEEAASVRNALAALNLVSRDENGRLLMPVTLKKGAIWLGPVKFGRVESVFAPEERKEP
jgi:hypothetical protein